MIAVLRVRFTTNTDASTVWPDATFANWLDPAIPFSLGNYWWESAWGSFDLSYQLFPTMVMADPRLTVTIAPGDSQGVINAKTRGALVNGAIAQATASFLPFWDQFDIVLVWFAQPTDMFGGGSYSVALKGGGTKTIPATVLDPLSPFDGACQELGHGFGLKHEIDAGRNDYRSPYSAMSARIYGDQPSSFLRNVDTRLPDGMLISNPRGDRFFGLPAGRVVGPALTPAQLLFFPWFQNPLRVITVPATYASFPVAIKLFALDHARGLSQSAMLPVMAVLPPNQKTGYWFTVELRRRGDRYDQAIGGTDGPPEGLVVHTFTTEGRVRYEGVLPLSTTDGDLDWTSVARLVTLRLVEVGANHEWAEFKVMNGPFQQQRNVNLDQGSEQATERPGSWQPVRFDEPCVRGVFSFRPIKTNYHWTLFANSYGFEAPKYRWYLNGTLLAEGKQVLKIRPEVFVPAPPVGAAPSGGDFLFADVTFSYQLTGNRLDLDLVDGSGNFTATVRAVAHADTSVDQFEVDTERYLNVKCIRYEWDQAYKDKLDQCYGWVDDVVDMERPPILIDPGDPPSFHVRPDDVAAILKTERAIHLRRSKNPEQAEEMITYLVQRFNVPRATILSRVRERGGGRDPD